MREETDNGVQRIVTEILVDLGVPAHLKGYRYMRSAICMAAADMVLVGSVTKLLYPEIAKQYNTTDGKVERAIRNAIEVSWARGNVVTFEELFGYCSDNGRVRPTNSEYIAVIADKVRMQCNYK